MAAKFYFDNFSKTESAEAFLRSHILNVVERVCGHRYTLVVRITGEDRTVGEVSLESTATTPIHLIETKARGEKFFELVTRLGEKLREKLKASVKEPRLAPVTVPIQ